MTHSQVSAGASGRLQSALVVVLLAGPFCVPVACPQTESFEHHYRRGSELARSRQFEEALDELRRAADLKPEEPRTHNMIGVVLTQLGRLEDAERAYTQALSIAPSFVPARKNRAVNAFTRRRYEFAASEFHALVRLTPDDFVPHLFLGLISIENLEFQAADSHLAEARRHSPGNSKILIPLARVRFILGERSAALDLTRELMGSVRTTEGERFELAAILAQFEANAEAEQLFRSLKQKQPGSYELVFNLALVQYRLGRLPEALQTLQDFAAGRSLTGEMLNLRGWIYNKMRRFSEAERSLRDAIRTEPDDADNYLDLSTVLGNSGDTEGAIQVVSEAIARKTGGQRLRVQLGLLYQKKRDHPRAEGCFKEVLSLDRANRPAYLALANLLASTDRQQEALAVLERGIGELPADALLHYMYGGQLLDSGREAQAEAMLKKALELNPLYANTHYLLGKLFLKRGDDNAAQTSFNKACAFDPHHAGAYYQLSLIARRKGDKAQAQEYGRIVQRLNEQSDREYQDSFHQAVDESLRENRRSRPSR